MIYTFLTLGVLALIIGLTVRSARHRRKAGGFRMTVIIGLGIWALMLWNTVAGSLLTIDDDILSSLFPEQTIEDIEVAEEGDDWDLPVEDVPKLHPDTLGVADMEYDRMPVLETENEVASYILSSMLREDMDMEFYMSRELAGSEKEGEDILDDACTTIMVYYLFGSFDYDDFRVKEYDDEEGLYVSVEPAFTDEDLDLEARAEACEYVLKHPVPEGGFTSFREEKEYARDIHDYLAKKLTYSDVGDDYEKMQEMDMYEARQEAYNALGEGQDDAVCAGYAKGFALIAQYAGIDCAWVWGSGEGDESHAWNMIYPCDGSEPVIVDVTWDDDDEGGRKNYDYFYCSVDDEEHQQDEKMEDFLEYIHRAAGEQT